MRTHPIISVLGLLVRQRVVFLVGGHLVPLYTSQTRRMETWIHAGDGIARKNRYGDGLLGIEPIGAIQATVAFSLYEERTDVRKITAVVRSFASHFQ